MFTLKRKLTRYLAALATSAVLPLAAQAVDIKPTYNLNNQLSFI